MYCEDYDGFRNFLCYVVYGSFWGIMRWGRGSRVWMIRIKI